MIENRNLTPGMRLVARYHKQPFACERTGRVCYGMELEPLYVDVARMRWEAFTGEKARRSGKELL